MKTFEIQWANGTEIVTNVMNVYEAVSCIKTTLSKIQTSYLVRFRELNRLEKPNIGTWTYWDAEQFWKYLKYKEGKSR